MNERCPTKTYVFDFLNGLYQLEAELCDLRRWAILLEDGVNYPFFIVDRPINARALDRGHFHAWDATQRLCGTAVVFGAAGQGTGLLQGKFTLATTRVIINNSNESSTVNPCWCDYLSFKLGWKAFTPDWTVGVSSDSSNSRSVVGPSNLSVLHASNSTWDPASNC